MSITKAQAQEVTTFFASEYPGALGLAYYFRGSVGELYGAKAVGVPATIKGGYLQGVVEHAGKRYHGRVDVPLGNMADQQDLWVSLKHEVLGHYGINSLPPKHKRALLDALIDSRDEPGLSRLWAEIDARYAEFPLDVRAEEIFAAACESVAAPDTGPAIERANNGPAVFSDTCTNARRPMSLRDLEAIAHMVADRLRDPACVPLTMPGVNDLPRQERSAGRRHDRDQTGALTKMLVPPQRQASMVVSCVR